MSLPDGLQEELAKRIEQLEKIRKKKHKTLKVNKFVNGFLGVFYGPSMFLCVLLIIFPVLLPVLWPAIPIALGAFLIRAALNNYVFKNPAAQYKRAFKKDLVEWLMVNINETYTYSPEKKIPQEDLQTAHIFKDRIDVYHGEDYVEGDINGVHVTFCEGQFYVDRITFGYVVKKFISVIFELILSAFIWLLGGNTGNDNDGSGVSEDENLIQFFGGLLMIADFNRKHNGSLHILPKKLVRNNLYKKDFYNGKRYVEMDNQEFNEVFSVYTAGAFEAHYVLSVNFMQQLLELHHATQCHIYLSLHNGELFLGLDWRKDLFERDIKKPVLQTSDVDYIVSQILFFENLVKQLSLEKKIWMAD